MLTTVEIDYQLFVQIKSKGSERIIFVPLDNILISLLVIKRYY